MMQIFQIIVLVFSAIVHEYMHGWMAERLGDNTAKDMGRLTLNPIPHIDLFGSIILPMLMIFSGTGIVFGWAKPVPYNPNNLRDKKYGGAKVALAGPLGNLILALMVGLVIRFVPGLSINLIALLSVVVFINLILMVFNLLPIPPLDGSKIILPFLPVNWQMWILKWEKYGIIILLFFLFIAINIILPIITFLMKLIIGNQAFGIISSAFGL